MIFNVKLNDNPKTTRKIILKFIIFFWHVDCIYTPLRIIYAEPREIMQIKRYFIIKNNILNIPWTVFIAE